MGKRIKSNDSQALALGAGAIIVVIIIKTN
jgi:hypothetical protein